MMNSHMGQLSTCTRLTVNNHLFIVKTGIYHLPSQREIQILKKIIGEEWCVKFMTCKLIDFSDLKNTKNISIKYTNYDNYDYNIDTENTNSLFDNIIIYKGNDLRTHQINYIDIYNIYENIGQYCDDNVKNGKKKLLIPENTYIFKQKFIYTFLDVGDNYELLNTFFYIIDFDQMRNILKKIIKIIIDIYGKYKFNHWNLLGKNICIEKNKYDIKFLNFEYSSCNGFENESYKLIIKEYINTDLSDFITKNSSVIGLVYDISLLLIDMKPLIMCKKLPKFMESIYNIENHEYDNNTIDKNNVLLSCSGKLKEYLKDDNEDIVKKISEWIDKSEWKSCDKSCTILGGRTNYYDKYMKYKNKYLSEKKQLKKTINFLIYIQI